MRPPLALTPEQRAAIQAASERVPAAWRPEFIAAVIDALAEHSPIFDVDVVHACDHARRQLQLGNSQPLLDDDDD